MHAFRILNVFTVDGDPFSGNPLCVFEDARGLSDAQMQSLARQMNLSETTFVLPATNAEADARVRIFTPGFEMPFAGHPTLGTASVVAAARKKDRVTLEMIAGIVPVERDAMSAGWTESTHEGDGPLPVSAGWTETRDEGDGPLPVSAGWTGNRNEGDGPLRASARESAWTLRAAKPPATRTVDASRDELSAMLGLPPGSVSDEPLWVNTGVEQLVIPLASTELVRATKPVMALIEKHGFSATREEAMAYVWARDDDGNAQRTHADVESSTQRTGADVESSAQRTGADVDSSAQRTGADVDSSAHVSTRDAITVRFFFTSNGALLEDPATGSACANLGGWFIARDAKRPMTATLSQGSAIERPSRLGLRIDERDQIFVTGAVIELGRGTVDV